MGSLFPVYINTVGGTIIGNDILMTAGRDINMFHIWVYQPK